MFGLSLTKILFTVIGIVVIWKVFRYLEARGQARLDGDRPEDQASDQSAKAVEDLIECAICRTYVPASGSDPCDRPDCPYRA